MNFILTLEFGMRKLVQISTKSQRWPIRLVILALFKLWLSTLSPMALRPNHILKMLFAEIMPIFVAE